MPMLLMLLWVIKFMIIFATVRDASLKEYLRGIHLVIMIRTSEKSFSRYLVINGNTIRIRNKTREPISAAMVWKNSALAYKTIASGYDGSFIRALDVHGLVIEGDAEKLYLFISIMRRARDAFR